MSPTLKTMINKDFLRGGVMFRCYKGGWSSIIEMLIKGIKQ